jgi:hypothetical protein
VAFNPARCKTGDKPYVYWAAGNQVFRFKYKPAEPIYLMDEAEKAALILRAKGEYPFSPNPEEPEGCFGNPLRFGLVPYMRTFDQELFQKIAGRKLNTGTAGVHGYFAIREDQRVSNMGEQIKKWFDEDKNHWQRTSGIYESVRDNGIAKNDYSVSHAFKIDKTLLPKHAQVDDIYVSLRNDAASATWNGQNGKVIESGFNLFGNLRIATSFRIFPHEIDLLIPYYNGLVDYVLQAHVPSYRWAPTQTK